MAETDNAGKGTILVIEDDAYISQVYERALTGAHYAMLLVSDGGKALDMLESLPAVPVAIILDIMLPTMDGDEILRRIRALPRYDAVPVMILTNAYQEDEKERFAGLGADAFLVKAEHVPREIIDHLTALIERKAKRG